MVESVTYIKESVATVKVYTYVHVLVYIACYDKHLRAYIEEYVYMLGTN